MKIGIFTLPLRNNYGGILQAYALQQTLRSMNHNAPIVGVPSFCPPFVSSIFTHLRFWEDRMRGKRPLSPERYRHICRNFTDFCCRNIEQAEARNIKELRLDAYVVGSDQVWRRDFSRNIEKYYFSFAENLPGIKLSYAASFGLDSWQYEPKKEARCAALLKHFSGISVREQSAVKLVADHLGQNATLVLDPTMLLDAEKYSSLIENNDTGAYREKIFSYILNPSAEKSRILEKSGEVLNKDILSGMPKRHFAVDYDPAAPIEDYEFPSVENWLKGIRDADFVITDSFHGSVFSILFQKPFIAIGNSAGGMARFQTLFDTFGLNHRLISRPADVTEDLLHAKIPYGNIMEKLSSERKKSRNFLIEVLKK